MDVIKTIAQSLHEKTPVQQAEALAALAFLNKRRAANPVGIITATEAAAAKADLHTFVQTFWRFVEPDHQFVDNWHIRELCNVLMAVTRGEIMRVIINIPPGSSKPVWCEERVLTETGYKRLAEVRVGDRVLTHRGRFRSVTAVHEQGMLPTVTIRTWSGREVRTAPDHPFLTPNGWVAASDLRPGNYVGVPHRAEPLLPGDVGPEEARLLGYLVGDGCISQRSLTFTSGDEECIADFIRCAKAVGFHAYVTTHPNPNVRAKRVVLRSDSVKLKGGIKRGSAEYQEPPVLAWLIRHGLYRSDSYSKRIPPAVLSGGEDCIKNFIGAYWSCDGTFTVRHLGPKTTMLASATTVSHGLARDLQAALSAINIDTRVRRHEQRLKVRPKRQSGEKYESFIVVTTCRNEVAKFADMPGLLRRKASLASQAFRDRFDPEFYEDEVLEVVKADPAECRCLTVEEDESFTAGSLAVHNSIVASCMWPAWEWANNPALRYLTASYGAHLSIRDNLRVRDICRSDSYQTHYALRFTGDQNVKELFKTTARGWRFATSVGGAATGEHPDRSILDDPSTAAQARSEAERENARQWFKRTISTRGVARKTRIVVIAQRLHEDDLPGYLLKLGGWENVMFPMRFEPERADKRDPRTERGELLWPAVFPESAVRQLELDLDPVGAACQLQQRPIPEGGGLFKRTWFGFVDEVPVGGVACRGWDIAATEGAGDWTVGVRIREVAGIFYVEDVRRGQWGPHDTEKEMLMAAHLDGKTVRQREEQEGGAAGKSVIAARARLLAGFDYGPAPTSGDKIVRARPFRAQCEAGNVKLVRATWNSVYLDELESFPNGSHDDQVDGSSAAFNELTGGPRAVRTRTIAWG